jgi:hypothetical protein
MNCANVLGCVSLTSNLHFLTEGHHAGRRTYGKGLRLDG